ncbi:serine hydrolase [Fodinibius halophilus]|uniref:beta-lactamase n=1 Tax=Fodinibius halophilus TaxID=1736908 RepID=A0A6M1T6M8_9BACT|nr:serine hydrolase [Fodinibius halophilus]NGP89807.1 serine hydrolase [Fodinibius halophilus]
MIKKRSVTILYAFILIVFFSSCTSSNSVETVRGLKSKIKKQLKKVKGDFAVAFKNLSDTSQAIYINEREKFHAASTMKTPVMIELFNQAENGRFSLDDSITVKNEFRSIVDSSRYEMDISEDSEGKLYDMIGKKRSIRQLITDMITMSSNLATNILIQKVGAHNVTQTMRSYGVDSIMVLRGVEDIKAYEKGLSNRTTALDEAIIYEQLGKGQAVSREASEAMIEILIEQHFNEMIPAQLPESVVVAHKTGWITGVNHDAGLIILPNGHKYVLVLLSKNAPNRERVQSAFADISGDIYKFIAN